MIILRQILTAVLISVSFSVAAVELEDSGISFEPPADFILLPANLVKIKYPRPNPPRWVYSNEDASVTVAIKLSKQAVTNEQLNELLQTMVDNYPKIISNLVWLKKEVAEFKGHPWLHIEFTSAAIDTDIHNHLYMTPHRGYLIAFNFNATKKKHEQYKTELQQSFDSIKLAQ